MAYTNFQHCTEEEYTEIIYSQGAKNKLKIVFNGVELEDADRYCEKLTSKSRILPDDASKRFSLDNFVSKELELILHRLENENIIQDQVEISIGTVVDSNSLGDIYEYVPLGIFNIQDTPTTDKDKITIKLRDNRVKFDFNYNGKELIDENGGQVTKIQILEDICDKAGVETDITSFLGDLDVLATYDNTITATTYISYLAEQSGSIATIDRTGKLIFVNINDLQVKKIPLSLIEKYEKGTSFSIERVVYEDAIRKFETSDDETLNTLYINSANPYISNQEQIDNIFSKISNVYIDSVTTGKVLGNPAIDSYDVIEVYGYYEDDGYGNKTFVPDENTIVFRTLANNTLSYTGVMISEYKTEIGLEERQENVTLIGEPTFRRIAKTNIDNINNNIEMLVAEQNETNERLSQTIQDVYSIQNLFQITGGNNLIKDSQKLLGDEGLWDYGEASRYSLFPGSNVYPMSNVYPIEYFFGEPVYVGGYDATLIGKTVSIAKLGVSNGKMSTSATNITGLIIDTMYTLSFKITNEENTSARIKLIGNGNVVYQEIFTTPRQMEEIVFSFVANTSNYVLEIQSTSTTSGFTYIYDLMLNKGDVQTWEPSAGEIVSTTLKLSQLGFQVYSTGSDIATLMTAQGFDIRRFQNGTLYEIVTTFNKEGFKSKKGILDELQVGNFEYKTVNYQGYETLVLYKKESDS